MPTIRELREARGWTQQVLAAQAGVAVSTIYAWESGGRSPSAIALRYVARALGVSMDDIALPERHYRRRPAPSQGAPDAQ